jgi:outer membrane murein-binding lipoprotein Lpp
LALSAAVVVGAMLAAGCGSNDQSTEGGEEAATPLTKAQFVEKAESLCQQSNQSRFAIVEKEAKEIKKRTGSPPTRQELERMTRETMIPSINKLIDDLSALTPPQKDSKTIESMLQKFEEGVQAAETDPAKFIEGGLFESVDKAFAAYGMDGCTL